MKTLRAIHDGLKRLTDLPRHEQDWVSTKLRDLLLPQDAFAASKLLHSVRPRTKPISVFLSHNSKDKPFVRSIYRYLSNRGLRVWIDEAELNAGDSLIEALANAVFRVDCVVAVISKASVTSKWVKKELAWAMSREIKGRRVRVIPIKKDNAHVPNTLADKLYLNFSTAHSRAKNKPVLFSSILQQTSGSADRLFTRNIEKAMRQIERVRTKALSRAGNARTF